MSRPASPHFSPSAGCGDVSPHADGVMLSHRSSTYCSSTPPVGSVACLVIARIYAASLRRPVRNADQSTALRVEPGFEDPKNLG